MRKTLLTFGVLLAVVCCTLAYATTGHSPLALLKNSSTQIATNEANSKDLTGSEVGVSIGTIDAQPYYESGLNLSYFGDAEYVAQISEGTYMGFSVEEGQWIYDPETGNEYYNNEKCAFLVAISSNEESVTIPDNIKVGKDVIPVTEIKSYRNLSNGFSKNIKSLTVPATVKSIYYSYSFDQYLEAMYMLGDAPSVSSKVNARTIYVCDKSKFSSFLDSSYYAGSAILPYGWEFDWITVNVEKKGEFAETYLTQNDYDWGAAYYVKVIGNINDTDLSAIKNLTSLLKLDLSETTITSLPAEFMVYRTSLTEVLLPSTLKSLGNSAFCGCTSLQSFDLNGITTIGSSVFQDCRSLSFINLTGVVSIGNNAFYGCSSLKDIDLSTVVNIGSGAFYNCTSLCSIDLTSAVNISNDSGNYGSFANCSNLESVIFGEKLQSLGYYSFEWTGITKVVIPKGLQSLSSYVFRNCNKLVSVELPSSLTIIQQNAFANCGSLTEVVMKKGLLTIQSNAFNGCTSLEEVTIPSTVTSIGQGAFNNTNIKSFKCYAAVPPAASSSFIGINMDMSRTFLYVPPFSKDFYRNTQYWSDFYLMRSIEEQVDYILVDRPLEINLEEEDNFVVANNPEIVLSTGVSFDQWGNSNGTDVGQLTAIGEGTLSAGHLTVNATLGSRSYNLNQYCPTLINYADKMRADNVTHNISFSYDRYGYQGNWYFISLPYDVKVSDIVPSNNTYWIIRRYDSAARAAGETSSTWVNLTNEDTMEAGKGYIVSAVGGETITNEWGETYTAYPRLTFTSGNSLTKNNLFRSADVIVPLTEYVAEFAHNRSWNLIGNPYPCYFDMHFLNEEFTAPVTVWNGSSYVAYSPVDDDLVLSPYEAFFVQCPLDANEITFKEAGRMHENEGKSLYKSPALSEMFVSAEGRNVFNFELRNDNLSDRARIVLNPEAVMEYEVGRDASKFFADNSDCAQVYVAADVNYSISERPVGDGVAILGVRASKEETNTLSLNGRYNPEWHVILTDNLTGAIVDLTESEYQFVTTPGDSNNRFSIKFMLADKTGIESVVKDFGSDTIVTVAALDGVVVYVGRVSEINVPAAGLYIITDGQETRKAILK